MRRRFEAWLSRTLERYRHKRVPLPATPDVSGKTFLFIGGLHRSGTSILHRLLCEHPAISGFGDTGVAEDEGQHLQSVYPAAHRYGGPGEFALDRNAHLIETSDLVSRDNRDKLLREWGAYYDLSKTVLLEKSPPNLIMSRFLRALLPGSKFVFIVRHPVAVSLATAKWSKRSLAQRMLHWRQAHAIMLGDIGSRDDCLVIRYEDLVASPAATLDRIRRLAGLDRFSPAAAIADHNGRYFAQWQGCSRQEIDAAEAVLPAGDELLERFGYALSEPFVDRDRAPA